MKTIPVITAVLFLTVIGQAQPTFQQRLQPLPPPGPNLPARLPGVPPPDAAPAKEHVNYLIRVEWQEPKGDLKSLEVLTTDGHFELDTIQKTPVKINNNEIPTTLRFSGTLTPSTTKRAASNCSLAAPCPT